ncbi:MAG: sugar phosphate isomerase/epimerase [Clostridiales bacterium]|nr:sugar phosphate isomerase/epimerase [Clostridiales bacterium]
MGNQIKYGVTLYSYSNEFTNGDLTFEEILRMVKAQGYTGIEIVAAQMVPGCPYPSDEWLEGLKSLLAEIGLEPVCWSAYVDMGIRADRDLTEDEIIQFTVNDLICAKKAGFPLVRTQHAISPKIFRQMIPFCRDLDMKLTIEMHHPHHPNVPVWKEYLELMRGEGKGVLGVVPDMSIFQNHPHALWIKEVLGAGVRRDVLDRMLKLHAQGASEEEILAGELTDIEKFYGKELIEDYNGATKVEQLPDLLDCAFYIHGKFYYINEELKEIAIPYEEILPTIRDCGYSGYMACEYEGHHHDTTVSAVEQLDRYVQMCDKLLG